MAEKCLRCQVNQRYEEFGCCESCLNEMLMGQPSAVNSSLMIETPEEIMKRTREIVLNSVERL
jgi:hypothetical protein